MALLFWHPALFSYVVSEKALTSAQLADVIVVKKKSRGSFADPRLEDVRKETVAQENNCSITLPSRTRVMGRPVLLWNSIAGSIPRL